MPRPAQALSLSSPIALRPVQVRRRSSRRRRRVWWLSSLILIVIALMLAGLGHRAPAEPDFVLVPAPQEALIDASVMLPVSRPGPTSAHRGAVASAGTRRIATDVDAPVRSR